MRKVLFLMFYLTSNCFASYSNSNTSMYAGGWGVEGSTASGVISNLTVFDTTNTILSDCTITQIDINVRRHLGETAGVGGVKVKILSEFGGTYSVEHDIDISAEFNDAPEGIVSTISKAGSWQVSKGWMLGYWCESSLSAGTCLSKTGLVGISNIAHIAGDQTVTFNLPTILNDSALCITAFASTNEFVVLAESSLSEGRFLVPAFISEPYYIILERIKSLGRNKDYRIELEYTDGLNDNAVTETVKTIISVDYSEISLVSGLESKTVNMGELLSCNIYIYIDPVLDKMEVYFANMKTGQGGYSGLDIRALSVSSRVPLNITDSLVRRINLRRENGGGLEIEKLVVCRKPVLVIGDSFTSKFGTELAHVGARLDDLGVFSEQRYVINGGVTGSRLLSDTPSYHTAIRMRWDGPNSEWCAFRDVLVCFVNGPGLNDISYITENSTNDEIHKMAGMIVGSVGRMVCDAVDNGDIYGGNNDTVVCGMIPFIANTGVERTNELKCQLLINDGLEELAYIYNVPFARFWGIPEEYIYVDGAHPTSDGDLWLANKIVDSYENSIVPPDPMSRGKSYFLYEFIDGWLTDNRMYDFNGDGTVDLHDFATTPEK